ncbi:FecR family protein [Chitinophaga sp. MM2321]|uniref:FecR family protein n=1 Tax=Chitinophaga sp. MM2321 TaxID=3137178 RepID=UPI0032D568BD
MLDRTRYIELLKKYLDGTIDDKERIALFEMTVSENIEQPLAEMMEHDFLTHPLEGPDLPVEVSEGILKKIVASEENANKLLIIRHSRKLLMNAFSIAAVVAIIVLGGVFYYYSSSNTLAEQPFEASIPVGNQRKVNNTSVPMEIVLADNSVVKLAPHSTLSFPEHFTGDKREVYLTGEAFFTIAKKNDQPFLVYYNNVVTRVLGTSFNIKTNSITKDVEVSVRTGKVQVIENTYSSNHNKEQEELKSVILVPNQKAMYDIKRREFATSLADSIYPLLNVPNTLNVVQGGQSLPAFFFQKATSLKEIFLQLETVYGIAIIVDNDNIYDCVFTGDISKQEMLEKLHIVCLTIGATYEVNGTTILVTGKGCN